MHLNRVAIELIHQEMNLNRASLKTDQMLKRDPTLERDQAQVKVLQSMMQRSIGLDVAMDQAFFFLHQGEVKFVLVHLDFSCLSFQFRL